MAIVVDPGDKSINAPKEMISLQIERFISGSGAKRCDVYSLTVWTSNFLGLPELS